MVKKKKRQWYVKPVDEKSAVLVAEVEAEVERRNLKDKQQRVRLKLKM